MGYYTYYSLEVLGTDNVDEIIDELREFSVGASYAIDNLGDSQGSEKWYDNEKDMKEFSKKHPEVLFKLKGDGEETDDNWVQYFKNGKTQFCMGEIVYKEFDESKLK